MECHLLDLQNGRVSLLRRLACLPTSTNLTRVPTLLLFRCCPLQIDWSNIEGTDDILRAVEQQREEADNLRRQLAAAQRGQGESEAVRQKVAAMEAAKAEAETLRRDLSTVKGNAKQLTTQLEQERGQSESPGRCCRC